MSDRWLTVLGSFVADLAFRTPQLPAWGQTIMGSDFRLGPGGKGSNQAVAAARLGAKVSFISKLGRDPFGDLARETYKNENVDTRFLFETEHATGAASIVVHESKGENAIVVVPGACFQMTTDDVDLAKPLIEQSSIFMTQLELPIPVVERGLAVAHRAGVPTILNPAPAFELPRTIYPLCDYFTPNESEAAGLTGEPVTDIESAKRAADEFLRRGVRNVVITLGAEGALVKNREIVRLVPAFDAGPVVETTGAGDAFNGGFAVALSEGRDVVEAARFGCAVAGISVTRPGTAPSMPRRGEVDALMRRS
ncbi:MAG TPA: ribokinase [Thermoanaerobaculia bacterium]|nr:ribokinase [Thermoanaerobaculia bacterium]